MNESTDPQYDRLTISSSVCLLLPIHLLTTATVPGDIGQTEIGLLQKRIAWTQCGKLLKQWDWLDATHFVYKRSCVTFYLSATEEAGSSHYNFSSPAPRLLLLCLS